MKSFATLFTVLCTFSAFAQEKNYLDVRDQLRPPLCGIRDSLSATEVYASLKAFDTNGVSGLAQYYQDLAEMEYLLFMYRGDSQMLSKSIKSSLKELHHNPVSEEALWSVAFGFHLFGECERMETYLSRFRQHHRRAFRKKSKQIALMRNECIQNHERIFGKRG